MDETAARQEALAAKRQKQKEREEKWVETQIIGFTSWINSFVQKRGKKVENLETDLRDGLMLVDFLELAAAAKFEGIDKKPKGKIQSLQNLSICLNYVSDSLKVRLLGINAGTIYDGNLKLILGMIWSIFRSPKITNIDLGDDDASKKGKKSFESNLLQWVRERVVNYGLSVTDFKSSFNDGQVFAALIHSIEPESLDFETISPATPAKNLTTAFDAGLKSLQVPCLLSVDDMVAGDTDERSVVLYTSLLFHAWTALGAKAVDNQIHAKLQREKEAKERMKDELEALKAEIAAAQRALGQRTLNSHGLTEENERLRKLLEALQKKSKVADDTISSLETKVNTLNQLGGEADKKYFRSREGHRDFLAAGADGKSVTGSSAPNDETSSWFVKPNLAKGKEGKVTVYQAETGKVLCAGAEGAELRGIEDEDSEEAEWALVAGPDGGSALKSVKNGEFLQLGEDGKVEFVGDKIAVFDILSKGEMTAAEQRARESARLAESFKRAGKTVQIQHNASSDFVSAGHGGQPGLSGELSDSSDWELVLNVDGSVGFKNTETDCFLNDDGGHISLGDTCNAKADFWLQKGEDGSVLLRNKATGDYVSHGGQKLITSDGTNLKAAGWSLVPRDPELAQSLASSLAQAGGRSLLQNALTRALVNSTPDMTERPSDDTEWEITASDDGCLVFKSKDHGEFLSSAKKGTIGVSGASDASAKWNVSRGADGDLVLQNAQTGEFLCQKDDGALSCTSSKTDNSSWIVKSEDGSFSSSGRSVGDARLGRRIAAGLDASGGNGLIKHSATQKFANNKPELSEDKDSELSKWNVSANADGSLTFKSKENGKYLIQAQDGELTLADEAEGRKANWGVSMGADGSLEIRNKATGNYLQKNREGEGLSVASLPHGELSKFDIESDNGAFSSRGLGVTDPSLAAAIGAGLAVAGGDALVQHATGSEYLSNKPGLSGSVADDTKWDITSNDNGTITIKDKASGNVLNQNADGSLSLEEAKEGSVAGQEWGVTKSKDGDLLIRSALNGNFLMRTDKGDLVSSEAQMGPKSGWVIKSENGLFSSRQAKIGGLRSVGKALAAALQAHGGVAIVQNGTSNEYIDNKPGMSAERSALNDFEIVADEDGSVSIKSKNSDDFLSEGDGGKLEMNKDARHASSKWTVTKEHNGNLTFRNNATEDFLVQQPDGSLAAVHSPEGSSEGWKVKSADGTFSSDSDFASYGMEDGFFMGEGMSVRDLEERNARLNREIDEAKDRVAKEMKRREELGKRMGNLKEMGDDNEQRFQELSKTIAELEEKADALQKLFDAEKHRKRQQDEAKAAAERELLEREAILRDAMERRERATKKLDKAKNSAKKEITKRKQREKEIAQLEAMKKQLEQRLAMSERTKVGLESLKRGLEDHLQDLSVWRGHQQLDMKNDFDLKKISADLEGLPLEQQMDYLDGMLQEENRCLQRISKAQGIAQPSETKILKKGTLSLFGKKEWKPRLCVLSGQNLEYYGNDDVKIGVVDLAMGCDVVRLKAIKDGKTKVWPLKLSINTKVKGDGDGEQQVVKKLFLRAATKAERQSWFTAVSSATSRINYRAETESSGEKIDPRIFSFISAGEDTPIYELFVDFRPISSAGINALRKGILYHDELHTLSLQQGQIGDEGLAKLTPSLDRLPNLRVVRLSGNRLTSDTVTAALKALTVQTTGLQEIDLSNNIIGVEAVEALAALLKKNPKVNFLNLSGNVLGDDGAVALAKVLQETQTEIPALEVNNNKIGDRGALALTEMANNNLNIGSILLAGNRVSSEGAVGMADLLRDNVNITNLDLSGNNIGAKGAQAFRDCLLDNIDLHVVNLSSNPLLCDDEQLAGMLHVEGFAIRDLSFVRGKSVKVAAKAKAAAAEAEAEDGKEEEEE